MSEYRYYEFQTIDRPLGEADMEVLRTLSTRARITAMSFTDHYKWGDFKGDPNRLIGRSRLDPCWRFYRAVLYSDRSVPTIRTDAGRSNCRWSLIAMEEFNGRRQPNGSLIEAPRGTGGNHSGAGADAASIPTSIAPLIERTFRHTSGLTAKMGSNMIPETPKEEQLDPLIKEAREFQIHCSAAHQNEHHRSVRQNPPTSIQRASANESGPSPLRGTTGRYRNKTLRRYFRGDAAFASPEVYEFLEAEGFKYAIRLRANKVLHDSIAHLLKRPVGRPPKEVRRYYANFSYRAGSWTEPRRVVAKVEWHSGELYPRVGLDRFHPLKRHQPEPSCRAGCCVLQSARHCRAMDQGRQERHQVDAAVMPFVTQQCRPAPAACTRL